MWTAIATGAGLPAARLGTEWQVEARGGGSCVVRMVMTGFGDEAGWDDEAAIRAVLDRRVEAFRAKDVDAFAGLYDAEAASLGLAPPLRSIGYDPKALQAWFESFDGKIDREVRDVHVAADGGVAFSSNLSRIAGERADGAPTDLWFRETVGLRRAGGEWIITHEHLSVPMARDGSDPALVDLKP